MALSTTIKNKMLSVTHLRYRKLVEIKNEDGDWIDFTGRDPVISQLRLSTEKGRNQIVSSISSVSFTNDDNYFDYMDDPDNATTISLFGTLATKFDKGFRGKLIRISLRMTLPDGNHEDARMGIYRIRRMKVDHEASRAVFDLWQDVDFLKKMGTENMSHGKRHYENRPITYLVKEIFKKYYRGGVTSSEFEIPDRIYIETADGEPAFSHWDKPPEKDTDGRWRDDITHNPTAMTWCTDNSLFIFGIMDEVWTFDPITEEWEKLGEFGNDDFSIRGIYRMDTDKYLVVGWETDQGERQATMKTGQADTDAGTFSVNSSGNDTVIFSGDFVLRDTWNTGSSPEGYPSLKMGRVKNYTRVSGDKCHGVNMPLPLPQWAHSGCDEVDNKGFAVTTGLRTGPSSGDWTDITTSNIPHGIDVLSPCYIVYANVGVGTSTKRPEVLIYWGMKPNLAYADSMNVLSGSFLFVVETDGDPLGIRCPGDVQIVGYSAEDGTHVTVSENAQTGDLAPMYGLIFYRDNTNDYLYWIDVNWVEEYIDVGGGGSASDVDPPIFRIKRGKITDNSGNPQILDSNRETLWTAGDNLFDADDSEFAAIAIIPYPLDGNPLSTKYLVLMMDMANIGGECFELFDVNLDFTSATSLGTSRYGWASFTRSTSESRIYFVERDTGRICYVDVSGSPTDYTSLDDGQEPVSQSFFEMPDGCGFTIKTESSKICIYGVSYPALPGIAYEDQVWIAGKYYFWKHHFQLTDRVELFEEDRQNAWEALGLLAEAVNYQVGIDPEGTGFFRPVPDGSESVEFTINLDSPIGRYLTFKKLDGADDIINRSQFIPYESTPGVPEATLDLIGYISSGSQVYFNGQTEVRSESLEEINITLHCIKGDDIGTAEFKYLIHEFQIQTALREDVNPSDLDLIRLDSNSDIEVDMLVQVGYYEGASGNMYVENIEADGDIDLSENLDRAYEQGTPVIFRSSEHGKWSTEYDTPDTWTSSSSFSEIGSTGLFLKFTADASPIDFAVGDRIRIYNPGLKLQRSRTKKFMSEDSESIERYETVEKNIDNPYLSLTLGREMVQNMVTNEADPHHGYEIDCPLFLQARPLVLIKVKSRKHLPTATDNEETCYIKQVIHDERNSKTKLILRAVNSYG